MDYMVFTDEGYITDSRFQSLSAFSFQKVYYDEIFSSIQLLLNESSVNEFKWKKLKDAKYYYCAEKFIKFILNNIAKYQIRVDTIIWDTYDSRHAVLGRNDNTNYGIMFFHLLNNSMKKRPKGSDWSIYPDVRGGIDWLTIHDCLRNVGKRQEYKSTIFGDFFTDPYYTIKTFEERISHEEIPIQIADLFSGLSVFSRVSFNCYKSWLCLATPKLFDEPNTIKLSNRESFRCRLLDMFNYNCKIRTLGVSLETKCYLHTFKPENPINFWHYEPQGSYDKAPVGTKEDL